MNEYLVIGLSVLVLAGTAIFLIRKTVKRKNSACSCCGSKDSCETASKDSDNDCRS